MTRQQALAILVSSAYGRIDELHTSNDLDAARELHTAIRVLGDSIFKEEEEPLEVSRIYTLKENSFFDCKEVIIVTVNQIVTFKTWDNSRNSWRTRQRTMPVAEFRDKYKVKLSE